MIFASNKMIFLLKIIPKILEKNNKIIIFSSFNLMLDIIEDCLQFKGWYCYERIDTMKKENEKLASINKFVS